MARVELCRGRDHPGRTRLVYSFAGLAIMLTGLGINLIGDWLDFLDPRLNV
jgi:ABC-type dipeptide/oligopeptide/nickel transport system permease subunit